LEAKLQSPQSDGGFSNKEDPVLFLSINKHD
jgi:hypothetical protein